MLRGLRAAQRACKSSLIPFAHRQQVRLEWFKSALSLVCREVLVRTGSSVKATQSNIFRSVHLQMPKAEARVPTGYRSFSEAGRSGANPDPVAEVRTLA